MNSYINKTLNLPVEIFSVLSVCVDKSNDETYEWVLRLNLLAGLDPVGR